MPQQTKSLEKEVEQGLYNLEWKKIWLAKPIDYHNYNLIE